MHSSPWSELPGGRNRCSDLAAPTGQVPGTKETKSSNQDGRMNGSQRVDLRVPSQKAKGPGG
jgi:hypothetical protein